jgi:hypothetical protein
VLRFDRHSFPFSDSSMQAEDINRFHDALKAICSAGVRVDLQPRRQFRLFDRLSSQQSKSDLDQLESEALSINATQNENAAASWESFASRHSDLPPSYVAALRCVEKTGNLVLPLQGLAARRMAEQTLVSLLKRTLTYVTLVMLVAVAGLILYVNFVVPEIDAIRADLELPAAVRPVQRRDITGILSPFVWGIAVLWGLTLVWMLLGGTAKVVMMLGGKAFVRCQSTIIAIRIAQLLQAVGEDTEEAATIASVLTGLDERSLGQLRSDLQSSSTTPFNAPPTFDFTSSLATFLELSANQRLVYLRVGLPITIMTIAGGSVALLYCIAIYWPLIALIRDLLTAGV